MAKPKNTRKKEAEQADTAEPAPRPPGFDVAGEQLTWLVRRDVDGAPFDPGPGAQDFIRH